MVLMFADSLGGARMAGNSAGVGGADRLPAQRHIAAQDGQDRRYVAQRHAGRCVFHGDRRRVCVDLVD